MALNDISLPKCDTCGGTGWKMIESTDSFGRPTSKAARCSCFFERIAPEILKDAHIPTQYEHCGFETFDQRGMRQETLQALSISKRWCEEFPIVRTGLLLVGPIGVGKTHLAVSAIKELIKRYRTRCLFVDYRELLKQIQDTYNKDVQTTELDVLQPVLNAEVLVLDELGAVRPSEWVGDTVSLILNTRYNYQRTTILTTNYKDLPPGGRDETLGDRIGERMRSRLHEMCRTLQMDGEDFRATVRNANFR